MAFARVRAALFGAALAALFALLLRAPGAAAFDDVPRAASRKAPAAAAAAAGGDDNDGSNAFTFTLEHSLSSRDEWTRRGRVRVEFSQLSRLGSVKVENDKGALDASAFQRLLDRDGFYRVRLRREGADDGDEFVMSAARACALLASGFREMMTLHADVYGNIVALDYRTTLSECHGARKLRPSTKLVFKSRARLSMGSAGERVVDTRVQEANLRRAREEGAQEKSFFQKYWMYIVPGVVIVLLQLVVPPEEAQKAAAQQRQ